MLMIVYLSYRIHLSCDIYLYKRIGDVFGVIKAYTTRVGDGPFPLVLMIVYPSIL